MQSFNKFLEQQAKNQSVEGNLGFVKDATMKDATEEQVEARPFA